MTHNPTIGERLGAPKHGYMAPKYRGGERKRKDGEAMRSAIKAYIRDHEGIAITQGDIAKAIETHPTNIGSHLKKLLATGQVSRERDGQKQRYYLGRQVPNREHGEVKVITPPAPVNATGYTALEREALVFLRGQRDAKPEALGYYVKAIDGYLSHVAKAITPGGGEQK